MRLKLNTSKPTSAGDSLLPNPLHDIAQHPLSAYTGLWYAVKCWESAARLANNQETLLNLHLWRLHEQLGQGMV